MVKKNHSSLKSVWVIFYKKDSKLPTISWSEAVDEALSPMPNPERFLKPDKPFKQNYLETSSGVMTSSSDTIGAG